MAGRCAGWLIVLSVAVLGACGSTGGTVGGTEVYLARTLHVTAPEGYGQELPAGVWQVDSAGAEMLRVRSAGQSRAMEVQATGFAHGERVDRPAATVVEDGPASVHLVLLEPDGTGRSARGTWSGTRSRGELEDEPLDGAGLRRLLDARSAAPDADTEFVLRLAGAAEGDRGAAGELAGAIRAGDDAAAREWRAAHPRSPAGEVLLAFRMAVEMIGPDCADLLGSLGREARALAAAGEHLDGLAGFEGQPLAAEPLPEDVVLTGDPGPFVREPRALSAADAEAYMAAVREWIAAKRRTLVLLADELKARMAEGGLPAADLLARFDRLAPVMTPPGPSAGR